MTTPDPPRKPPYHPSATVREQIAAGPKFMGEPGICAACGEKGPVDVTTGLERYCWRVWRWSSARERPNPYAATTEATR
jgi:hypothetical protein